MKSIWYSAGLILKLCQMPPWKFERAARPIIVSIAELTGARDQRYLG
jgi:hypothetical protein